MAEVVFEHFGFSKMQINVQALFALFAEGRLTATLLDSGDGVTHVVPIYSGYILKEGFDRVNVAGRHLTRYLNRLLTMRGYALNSTADFEIVRELKEKYCFISSDLKMDRKIARETTCYEVEHILPDGKMIKVVIK